jgi:hypothetical protein
MKFNVITTVYLKFNNDSVLCSTFTINRSCSQKRNLEKKEQRKIPIPIGILVVKYPSEFCDSSIDFENLQHTTAKSKQLPRNTSRP